MSFNSAKLRIDQVLPSFAPRDAIGYHTLKMQELIKSLGIESNIYADEIKEGMQNYAIPIKELFKQRPSQNRYILYQASTGSPVVRSLVDRQERLLINFHNITPKEILGRWDTGIGIVIGSGIKQLSVLSEKIVGAISVSKYNQWCLVQEGIRENSYVAAPFIPEAKQNSTNVDYAKHNKSRPGSNWLFVGRVTPNKAQHDIIKAFSAYRNGWDQDATLTLVGSVSSNAYEETLKKLIAELGLTNSVTMTGPIDDDELELKYLNSTVFVCLSDHEGFGFPIIEALRHNLPVVAFSSTAVGETLGNAGILLKNKEPFYVATAVAMIEDDQRLRRTLLEKSEEQLLRYSAENARLQNTLALRSLVPGLTECLK